MPGLTKNRFRCCTIAFHVSPEEKRQIEARLFICSQIQRSEYYRRALLGQEVHIHFGKFAVDHLVNELKEYREFLRTVSDKNEKGELNNAMKDCQAILLELLNVLQERKYNGKS